MKVIQAVEVLQSAVLEAARDEIIAETTEMTELQKPLATKSAELSQLTATQGVLIDDLSCVKLQNAAKAIVSDNRKSVAGANERREKSTIMTCQCRESSTTPLTVVFLALLFKQDELKNDSDAFTLENESLSGVVAEAKVLREKLADCEKLDAAARTALNGRGKKRATATNLRVVAPEAELAEAKTTNARLVGIIARSEANAIKARAELEGSEIRLAEVERE